MNVGTAQELDHWLDQRSLEKWMTNTIHVSVQCVMPGEVAEAHRHNAAAIRFVVTARAERWKTLCEKYRPLVEANRQPALAAL
jgi:hypothetical protein